MPKVAIEIRRGDEVPDGAIYLTSQNKIIDFKDSGHWQIEDTPIYAMFDVFLVEKQESKE